VGCRCTRTQLSGSAGSDRSGYTAALAALSVGGNLVVVRIDRLGRSPAEVAITIADLTVRGVTVRALRDGVDTGTATGRMIAHVMAAMELELGRERRAASPAARRARD
jgi:DNA invertase Pin-like site-specific DNA recombinase